jgi:hypothetical protein
MFSKRMIFTLFLVMAVNVYVFAQRQMYPPWPPQDHAATWEIKMDKNNRLSMTRHYTYGVVDRWLTIVPGYDSSSHRSGTVRYPNGQTREMTAGELAYFWDFAGAKYAFETHRK